MLKCPTYFLVDYRFKEFTDYTKEANALIMQQHCRKMHINGRRVYQINKKARR